MAVMQSPLTRMFPLLSPLFPLLSPLSPPSPLLPPLSPFPPLCRPVDFSLGLRPTFPFSTRTLFATYKKGRQRKGCLDYCISSATNIPPTMHSAKVPLLVSLLLVLAMLCRIADAHVYLVRIASPFGRAAAVTRNTQVGSVGPRPNDPAFFQSDGTAPCGILSYPFCFLS